jgi:hypothetical protein
MGLSASTATWHATSANEEIRNAYVEVVGVFGGAASSAGPTADDVAAAFTADQPSAVPGPGWKLSVSRLATPQCIEDLCLYSARVHLAVGE